MGAATEAKILKALAEGQGDEPSRAAACSGVGLPVVREVVEALRAHPAAIDVSDAGSTRRRRETFRDLDVIATATRPRGADRRTSSGCPGCSRSSRTATRRRP